MPLSTISRLSLYYKKKTGTRFTNDFLPAIQIRWNLRLAIIPLLAIGSQQNFCTRNNSTAVVSCTKFCSDHFIRIETRVKRNSHRIWIAMEKPSVKCGPVPYRVPESIAAESYLDARLTPMIKGSTYVNLLIFAATLLMKYWIRHWEQQRKQSMPLIWSSPSVILECCVLDNTGGFERGSRQRP